VTDRDPNERAPLAASTDPDVAVDWFGNPIHADGGLLADPVPCPYCGITFRRAALLEAHLTGDHRYRRTGGRTRALSVRLERWARGLAFMPLWFVLPLNVVLTSILYLAWGNDLSLFSTGDSLPVIKTWIIRLSILPSVVLLAWRTVDKRA
jgi:hypothetical protein